MSELLRDERPHEYEQQATDQDKYIEQAETRRIPRIPDNIILGEE